jgi:hypothetical protein
VPTNIKVGDLVAIHDNTYIKKLSFGLVVGVREMCYHQVSATYAVVLHQDGKLFEWNTSVLQVIQTLLQ